VQTEPNLFLIEDDPDLGVMLGEFVKLLGFPFELANNGFVAVKRLAELRPSLVLLDLHMPGRSGQEILAYIAAENRLAATKVIIITADLFADPAELFRADAILFKPFTLPMLEKAINRVMNSVSNIHAPPERLRSL
jgi:two-component system, OmpR family, alkaline phosphatase synthesis response regulator PhoP